LTPQVRHRLLDTQTLRRPSAKLKFRSEMSVICENCGPAALDHFRNNAGLFCP
jgi:hypothetical protein